MSTLSPAVAQWINRLGETDQLSLNDTSAALQQERIHLRLQLAKASNRPEEQQYFMLQAVSLAEQLRISAEQALEVIARNCDTHNTNLSHANDPALIHAQNDLVDATLSLFTVYSDWYVHTQDAKYLTIAEQIIKPLGYTGTTPVIQAMVRLYTLKKQPALYKHWTKKLANIAIT